MDPLDNIRDEYCDRLSEREFYAHAFDRGVVHDVKYDLPSDVLAAMNACKCDLCEEMLSCLMSYVHTMVVGDHIFEQKLPGDMCTTCRKRSPWIHTCDKLICNIVVCTEPTCHDCLRDMRVKSYCCGCCICGFEHK